jgi:hypothetical protein
METENQPAKCQSCALSHQIVLILLAPPLGLLLGLIGHRLWLLI